MAMTLLARVSLCDFVVVGIFGRGRTVREHVDVRGEAFAYHDVDQVCDAERRGAHFPEAQRLEGVGVLGWAFVRQAMVLGGVQDGCCCSGAGTRSDMYIQSDARLRAGGEGGGLVAYS